MFDRILPDYLLRIVDDYAQLFYEPTDSAIDVVVVQNMLNCWTEKNEYYFDALCDACRMNDFELVQWLCHLVSPKNSKETNYKNMWKFLCYHNCGRYYVHDSTYLLRIACVVGNKKMVKWLIEFFDYGRSDVRFMSDYCFIAAYANKHYKLARWLIKRYKIKKVKIQCYDYSINASSPGFLFPEYKNRDIRFNLKRHLKK